MGLVLRQMGIEVCVCVCACMPAVRLCARPVLVFMLLSGFGFGSAYTANLAFMITSILSPAGGSSGIFTEKWLNWISAQHSV